MPVKSASAAPEPRPVYVGPAEPEGLRRVMRTVMCPRPWCSKTLTVKRHIALAKCEACQTLFKIGTDGKTEVRL